MPQLIRRSAVVIATILGLVGYGAAIGVFDASVVPPFLADSAGYRRRFVASAIFLGVVPFVTAGAFRFRPSSFGLRRPISFRGWWWFAAAGVGAVFGIIGSLDPALAVVYPFHPHLAAFVADRGAGSFLLHATLYLVLYYVPWELSFRGIFVALVTEPMLADRERTSGAAIMAALLQAAPSALIHVGHPLSEVFGAVIFGIVAGYVTLATRSILPALVTHATAGIVLDLLLVLEALP